MSTEFVVLKSSDGQTFRIEKATARQSEVIAHLIEDCANQEIPISNVTGKILVMVVEYCKKHHVDDANPSADDEELKKWDKQFMQTDQSTLFELVLAAHHLSIKSLLDLTFPTAADMIKDKTPEEARLIFNIENDFTPEEEEARRIN